jgi:hypothetical protein
VHETYRMLGSEHEADLEREARQRDLAAAAGKAKAVTMERAAQRIRLWRPSLRGLALALGFRPTR